MDIVDAHPLAATVRAVIDAFKGHNIIEARANLSVHTGQSEWIGREILIDVSRVDDDFWLDQNAIEIDFDAILGIGSTGVQIEHVISDQESVSGS